MATDRIAFLASLGYIGRSPAEVCRSLASLGYTGVEWTLHHFDPRIHTPAARQELVRTTHEFGLEISELVVQQDVVCLDPDELRDRVSLTLQCIEAAGEMGVGAINVLTGPAPWDPGAPKVGRDIAEGEAWDMVLSAYEQFVQAAEKHRVALAVEGVFGMLCHDFYTTWRLMETFDSPWLGVNFDPSHDALYGQTDAGWMTREWARKGRLKHVHLKDAAGIPELGKFVFPMLGEGVVDWKGMFQALDDVGYTGFVSVEFESFTYYNSVLKADVEEAARVSIHQAKRLMA
jgi:sugar phosphate isomerase/epimerase